jgi:hypothetical protein
MSPPQVAGTHEYSGKFGDKYAILSFVREVRLNSSLSRGSNAQSLQSMVLLLLLLSATVRSSDFRWVTCPRYCWLSCVISSGFRPGYLLRQPGRWGGTVAVRDAAAPLRAWKPGATIHHQRVLAGARRNRVALALVVGSRGNCVPNAWLRLSPASTELLYSCCESTLRWFWQNCDFIWIFQRVGPLQQWFSGNWTE